MSEGLFSWIDALYTKRQPEGAPPMFLMHRFLASDRDLAIAARYLQIDLKRTDARIVFRVWQGLLPKAQAAPRLSYVAPKKLVAAERLTIRMGQVLGERRVVVEEIQALIALTGRSEELYFHFGIEPPTTKKETAKPRATPRRGGLLANL